MNQQSYDSVKQYYLDQLTILNQRAYIFYIKHKHLKSRELRSELWSSDIWREAKLVMKDLNEHLYGRLTCEKCFQPFNYPYIRSFQLHHIDHKYNWKKLFDPDQILLVHKHCHKEIHGR